MKVEKRVILFFLISYVLLISFSSAQSTCSQACASGQLCKQGNCLNVCNDGTSVGSCSLIKPLYCNIEKKLINNIAQCGCPNNKPIPLSSGYCGVILNDTAFLANHFEKGVTDKSVINPASLGLINILQESQVTLSGFICPNPIVKLVSPPNLPELEGYPVNLIYLYGSYGTKVLFDKELAPLYSYKGLLESSDPNFNKKPFIIPAQGDLCYIASNSIKPYIQFDLGSVKSFSQVALSFSYPFIIDYQILYSNNGVDWNVAYSGHDKFSMKDKITELWTFGQYGDADEGYTKLHSDFSTGERISFQATYGGVNYQSFHVRHYFNTVSGRYVRFVPTNWFEGAGLYEIIISNSDSQIQLSKIWDSSISQIRYNPEGSYESTVFFANVSSTELNYKKIYWDVRTAPAPDNQIVERWGPLLNNFITFDNDYPNDLGYRVLGYGGTSKGGLVTLSLSNKPNEFVSSLGSAYNAKVDLTKGVGKTSLSLDGVDDYAWAIADPILRLENNFTILSWVKPEQGGPVLSKGRGTNYEGTDYSLYLKTSGSTGQIKFFIRGKNYETPNNLPIDNNWHQVAVSYITDGVLIFYLDGNEVYRENDVKGKYAQAPFNTPYMNSYDQNYNYGGEFKVGAHGTSLDTPFKGNVDEIMIYHRALSQIEIQQIKNLQFALLGNSGRVTLSENLKKLLVAYWDFSNSVPAGSNLYPPYQYWSDYKTKWNNGDKIPNTIVPVYNQYLTGNYPEAGENYNVVAYGGVKCAFDGKISQTTNIYGIPNLPCVYHPTESTHYSYPYYMGEISYAYDSSNYRKDMMAIFGINTTSDAIKGRALELDGVDDYLARTKIPVMDNNNEMDHLNIGSGDFSGSFWIKSPSIPYSGILSKGRGNPGWDANDLLPGAYDLFVDGNGSPDFKNNEVAVNFRIIDANKQTRIVRAVYNNANEWHHIAFTLKRSTSEMKMYVDGVLQAVNTQPISTQEMKNNFPFIIGSQQFQPSLKLPLLNNFRGKIDELRLYGKELTVNEIQQLTNEKNNPVGDSLKIGLKGHWKFDELSYNYLGEKIGIPYSFTIDLRNGPSAKIHRIIFHELQDRASLFVIRTFNSVEKLYKNPTGQYNTKTVIDLSSPINQIYDTQIDVVMYVPSAPGIDERAPLIQEIELLELGGENSPPSYDISNFNNRVGFQFRSGINEDAVKNAPWTGPDGTSSTFYTISGQDINAMHKNNQYYQYKFIASTPNTIYSPAIDNIIVSYSGKVNQAPKAYIKTPQDIFANEDLELDGSLSRDDVAIIKYEWDFGDGNTGVGRKVSHRYTNPGQYNIHLKVYDSAKLYGETYKSIDVKPYNCLTPDFIGNADSEIFDSISGEKVDEMVGNALIEYAEKRNLPDISHIDTAEEYMEAALLYLDNHMSYLTKRAECLVGPGERWIASLDKIVAHTPICGCPENADFCGNCVDFSVIYTTLVRAMGVNSKCIYTATTETGLPFSSESKSGHAYNIVLYKGKYRIVEPQGNSLTSKFFSSVLEWDNGEVPYYLTGGILNDQIGKYEDNFELISSVGGISRQNDMNTRIKNYPGVNGLPDNSRECSPIYNLRFNTEEKRLNFFAKIMFITIYFYNIEAYNSASDKLEYSARFHLQKILHRTPTSSEVDIFKSCVGNVEAIYYNGWNVCIDKFREEFKQSFTLFATGANGNFMDIDANTFLTKLYEYLTGNSLSDRTTPLKDFIVKLWHSASEYITYKSYYTTEYDPLEVFEDVCP